MSKEMSKEMSDLIGASYSKEGEILAWAKSIKTNDLRSQALALTNIEQAFMWLRRSISGVKEH